MSKERLQNHKNRRVEKRPVLETDKLIKERLIWQHLARKKIKRALKIKFYVPDGE